LLVVALSPAVLQSSESLSCDSGDTTLAALAIVVGGEEQVEFHPRVRSYEAWLPAGSEVVSIRARPTDPQAKVYVNRYSASGRDTPMAATVGGGETDTTLEPGLNTIRVYVKAPGGASDSYETIVHVGSIFPCSEEGIRAAVAQGSGAHRFDCNEPTTVVTAETVTIEGDVVLDGEQRLTLDGNQAHGVLFVGPWATAELRGFTITRGAARGGAGISNRCVLSIVDCEIRENAAVLTDGGGIANVGPYASLSLTRTSVTGNTASREGGGLFVFSVGPVTIADSVISSNHAQYGGGIFQSSSYEGEPVRVLRSIISDNSSDWRAGGIYVRGNFEISDSTISDNFADDDGGGAEGAPSDSF
jgi:hypothetical protein